MNDILVLFHSNYGNTRSLAELIAQGINSVTPMTARIRTVPENDGKNLNDKYPLVSMEDFAECLGLALGSPTRFGNMSAPMKSCIDQTSPLWIKGTLVGKPVIVFTSTSSLHGGQESTLLSMMLPLLHHGMIILGIPSTEDELSSTSSGGTPYGVSHYAGATSRNPITTEERNLCLSQGKRLAKITKKLFLD
ncbi:MULTISPECIES: NAD(P)H:quinone oxidoreductase [Candidatus Ichthyocystis]|uniref:Flavoprotein WrbA n=1 Tax=Candidatus Ichthyocystis hellenicum TaxID=1561003 RepID=A0A0S4M0U9_9BURK|nr:MULTISPECIES: NAD(P)H:quinone oxidoreductase [Ichthyocystis]CUT16891.1 NAD(P)H:quinone oxidoreductase [Candidatus Ichthyocystis hellenicum]